MGNQQQSQGMQTRDGSGDAPVAPVRRRAGGLCGALGLATVAAILAGFGIYALLTSFFY